MNREVFLFLLIVDKVESPQRRGKETERMIIPVRCFSCGKVIGDKWEPFKKRVEAGEEPGKVLDDLGVTRYCCRRMILSHVEIIDDVIKFHEGQKGLEVKGGN